MRRLLIIFHKVPPAKFMIWICPLGFLHNKSFNKLCQMCQYHICGFPMLNKEAAFSQFFTSTQFNGVKPP